MGPARSVSMVPRATARTRWNLGPPPSRRFSPFSEFFRRKNNIATVLREEGKRAVGYKRFFFLIVTNQKGKLHWVRGRIEFRRESEEKIRRTKT